MEHLIARRMALAGVLGLVEARHRLDDFQSVASRHVLQPVIERVGRHAVAAAIEIAAADVGLSWIPERIGRRLIARRRKRVETNVHIEEHGKCVGIVERQPDRRAARADVP